MTGLQGTTIKPCWLTLAALPCPPPPVLCTLLPATWLVLILASQAGVASPSVDAAVGTADFGTNGGLPTADSLGPPPPSFCASGHMLADGPDCGLAVAESPTVVSSRAAVLSLEAATILVSPQTGLLDFLTGVLRCVQSGDADSVLVWGCDGGAFGSPEAVLAAAGCLPDHASIVACAAFTSGLAGLTAAASLMSAADTLELG